MLQRAAKTRVVGRERPRVIAKERSSRDNEGRGVEQREGGGRGRGRLDQTTRANAKSPSTVDNPVRKGEGGEKGRERRKTGGERADVRTEKVLSPVHTVTVRVE